MRRSFSGSPVSALRGVCHTGKYRPFRPRGASPFGGAIYNPWNGNNLGTANSNPVNGQQVGTYVPGLQLSLTWRPL